MDNMLDFDITLLIQLVNFIVTLVGLNFLLIKPVRNKIAERNGIFEKYTSDTIKFKESASAKLHTYEKALQEARVSASILREKIKLSALQQEKERIEKAQQEAQQFLNNTKSQIQKEIVLAEQELLAGVDSFAIQVRNKILF